MKKTEINKKNCIIFVITMFLYLSRILASSRYFSHTTISTSTRRNRSSPFSNSGSSMQKTNAWRISTSCWRRYDSHISPRSLSHISKHMTHCLHHSHTIFSWSSIHWLNSRLLLDYFFSAWVFFLPLQSNVKVVATLEKERKTLEPQL